MDLIHNGKVMTRTTGVGTTTIERTSFGNSIYLEGPYILSADKIVCGRCNEVVLEGDTVDLLDLAMHEDKHSED